MSTSDSSSAGLPERLAGRARCVLIHAQTPRNSSPIADEQFAGARMARRPQPGSCHHHRCCPPSGRQLGGQRDENLDQPSGGGHSVLRVLQSDTTARSGNLKIFIPNGRGACSEPGAPPCPADVMFRADARRVSSAVAPRSSTATGRRAEDMRNSAAGRAGYGLAQARIFAFSRSNSSAVMTPRSRRSASLASWSAELCEPAACWT